MAWRSALIALALTLASSRVVAEPAPSSKLEAAREAIAAVDYHAARDLLDQALEEGGHSPAEVAEIYRLAANTAIVLGQRTLADTYYRSWLSLDPKATVTSDAPAKFREPFLAAQAYVHERGAMVVVIGKRDDHSLAIKVTGDPLQLARTVAVGDDPAARRPLPRDRRVVFGVPAGKAMVIVRAFDQFGNRVFERSFATFSAIPPETIATTPLVRRWIVWAIPAVGLGVGAVYFQHEAAGAQQELDRAAGTRGEVFYDQVVEMIDRRDRNRHIALGLAIGASACAITAAVMKLMPQRRVTLAPAPSPAGVALVAMGTF